MTAATKTRSRKAATPSQAARREAARAKMTALLEQLDEYTEEIDGDDLAAARVAVWAEHYSERNAMLIVMQRPESTDIRTYGAWQALGRQVVKGETGIRILVPAGQAGGTEAQPATETAPAVDGKPGRRFFKLDSRFDVAQTRPMTEDEQAAYAARQAQRAAQAAEDEQS